MPQKIYLGDSVYAQTDGFYITLTTENGYGPSNTIHLEPIVLRALREYLARVQPSPEATKHLARDIPKDPDKSPTQEQQSEISQQD